MADPIETMLPEVLGAGQRGVQNAQQQQDYAYKQQQQAKQAPLEDMARQVKMQQLKNELKSAPNIAALLASLSQNKQGQPGQQGPQGQQQAPQSPQQIYQAETENVKNIWTMATDPRNPRNLIENPEALLGLKNMLKDRLDFAQQAMSAPLRANIGKNPEPLALVNGVPVDLKDAPPGSKIAAWREYDDKGQPKVVAVTKENASEAELTYQDWKANNPTTKDAKTGKTRESTRSDYEKEKKLEVTKAKQEEQDKEDIAVAHEVINGNADLSSVTGRNKSIVAQIFKIDPYFNIKLAHARYTSDIKELDKVKTMRGQIDSFEKTAMFSLGKVRELSKEVDRTGVPVLNRWILGGMKSIKGDPGVAKFDAAMTTFAGEYAKIMSSATGGGSVTSDSAREEIARIINTAMSQGQIKDVGELLQQEMEARKASLDGQIKITEDRIGGKKPEADLSKVDWNSFEKK